MPGRVLAILRLPLALSDVERALAVEGGAVSDFLALGLALLFETDLATLEVEAGFWSADVEESLRSDAGLAFMLDLDDEQEDR